jgi:hypothetical protein
MVKRDYDTPQIRYRLSEFVMKSRFSEAERLYGMNEQRRGLAFAIPIYQHSIYRSVSSLVQIFGFFATHLAVADLLG